MSGVIETEVTRDEALRAIELAEAVKKAVVQKLTGRLEGLEIDLSASAFFVRLLSDGNDINMKFCRLG